MPQKPTFIAFTGVDRPERAAEMVALSRRYPIEWGMLIDPAQEDKPLFPDVAARAALLATPGLRWAAHVCGEPARAIANDPAGTDIDLWGFTRLQVNHSFSGSSPSQIGNAIGFGRRRGVRAMLQCSDVFPADARLDWLYDVSFGTGVKPDHWPALAADGAFCGYSGGIGPDNAAAIVAAIAAPAGSLYWIDMESGIRTDGWLDLAKCAAVCRAVYGD
jgi:hypothetical protein